MEKGVTFCIAGETLKLMEWEKGKTKLSLVNTMCVGFPKAKKARAT